MCTCVRVYVHVCMRACVPVCVIYTHRLLKGSPSKGAYIRIYACMYLMVNIIWLYKDSVLRSYGLGVLPCLLVLYSIIYKPGVAHCSASLVYSKARTFSLDYSLSTYMRRASLLWFRRQRSSHGALTTALSRRCSFNGTATSVLPTTVLQMNNETDNVERYLPHLMWLPISANKQDKNVQRKLRACACISQ